MTKQRVLHILGIIGAVAAAGLVDYLTKGPYAHAVWAPTALALVSEVKKAFGGPPASPAP